MSMNHYRKLLIYAINELLEADLISLDEIKEENEERRHFHFAEVAGKPSVVLWRGIGYEELHVSVWWGFDREAYERYILDRQPKADLPYYYNAPVPLTPKYREAEFVAATASAWLERRDGKWLQGKGSQGILYTYLSKGTKALIKALPEARPLGYSSQGRFLP